MRLIDADVLIEKIRSVTMGDWDDIAVCEVERIINERPTASAEISFPNRPDYSVMSGKVIFISSDGVVIEEDGDGVD